MSIPHLFRCPISLDLFTDPVTLSTGQTYDRPSIEKWLAAGNLTCPVTMQRLHDPTLVPNHTLRHLIDQWLLSGTEPNSHHNSSPSKPIDNAEFSLATLKRNLQSPTTTDQSELEALRKIRTLSMESDTGQSCLIQLGFFPLLLQLLFTPRLVGLELIEVALDCVLGLSPCTQMGTLNMLKEETHLATMVDLFDHGNAKIRTSLCCLMAVATTSPITQDLCLLLGQTTRVVQILVSLLNDKSPTSNTCAAEAAARALSGLCTLEPNRAIAVREGAVDGLITFLSGDPTRRSAARALATVELMAVTDAGKKAVLRNPNGIRVLVKMVFRVSSSDDGGSEHAVGSLLLACCESGRARVEAVNVGVLSQLLLLLQSQCSSKAKAKGRALLKLLSSMWGEDP